MISDKTKTALSQILKNYANDENVSTFEAINGIDGLFRLDEGKTLRDEFAMAALTGTMLSLPHGKYDVKELAWGAYALADAMMEARNGKDR